MYSLFLTLHSFVRWAVIILGVIVIVRAIIGLTGKRDWATADSRFVSFFTMSMNIQFVLGLILYVFLSPIVQRGLSDFGGAMGDRLTRFWLVEHMIMMIVALGLTHVGSARVRKVATAVSKHRNALIFFGLTMVAIFLAIPWPGTGTDPRPLFRLGA